MAYLCMGITDIKIQTTWWVLCACTIIFFREDLFSFLTTICKVTYFFFSKTVYLSNYRTMLCCMDWNRYIYIVHYLLLSTLWSKESYEDPKGSSHIYCKSLGAQQTCLIWKKYVFPVTQRKTLVACGTLDFSTSILLQNTPHLILHILWNLSGTFMHCVTKSFSIN